MNKCINLQKIIKVLTWLKQLKLDKSKLVVQVFCTVALVLGSAIACVNAEPIQAVTFTTTQLTNNDVDDLNPRISGANIVWQSGKLDNYDIFFMAKIAQDV